MKLKLVQYIALPLYLAVFGVSADQDTLDFLYTPELADSQQLLLERITNHARNAEFSYAMTLSQTLLDESEHLRNSAPTTYGQILVNHGIIQSAAEDYDLGLSIIQTGLDLMEVR